MSLAAADATPASVPLPDFRETLEVRGFKGAALKQRRMIRA